MTKDQILRTLKSKHLKNKEVIGFDIETYGRENNFYMCGLYDDKKGYRSFYSKEKFIKYVFKIAREKRNVWIVATNLMFDFVEIFYKSKYWNNINFCMKGGRMLMAKYKDPSKNFELTFIDTLNYGGLSVKAMGDILKIPKLKHPKALGKIPINKAEKEELEIYNKRDCEVTYYFMLFLQKGFKEFGGKTKLTTSSTALDIFRRKHLKKWVIKEDFILRRKQENSIHKFIFPAYYGGRTEVFQRGLVKKHVKVYDINSMYPHAMLNAMPEPSSVKHTHNPKKFMLEFEGVSKVDIIAPNMYFPLLCKRNVDKNGKPIKLVFPKGKITQGTYTHVELRKALELGYKIIKMYETLYYKRTIFPFQTYVQELYKQKEHYTSIKSPMKHITKLLMNGLYGKLAEKKAEETIIIDPSLMTKEEYDKVTNKNSLSMTPSGLLTSSTIKEVYKQHVIPIWATYTTAYARINLFNYLNKYKGMYCDTDSVATLKSMPESTKIGGMKLEYDVKNAIFVKPKMYMYDVVGGETKVRIKGVSRATKEKFMNVMKGKSISYDKFTKLKEGVRRGLKPNSIQLVEKNLNLEDDKRKWITKFNPFELQDSEALTY